MTYWVCWRALEERYLLMVLARSWGDVGPHVVFGFPYPLVDLAEIAPNPLACIMAASGFSLDGPPPSPATFLDLKAPTS